MQKQRNKIMKLGYQIQNQRTTGQSCSYTKTCTLVIKKR